MQTLRGLFDHQSGVVSRVQLLERGSTDNDIRRALRRLRLTRVHPGVYVNHTGPLSWSARAWAAVLFHAPAVLARESAVYLSGDLVHVAIDTRRTPSRLPGVRVHRIERFDQRAMLDRSPPSDRFEEALIDLAGDASSPDDALRLLADACQRGRTTPARLRATLGLRTRTRHGSWLRAALDDLEVGARSVLESRFLKRVERAHGLPTGRRQHRTVTDGVVAYRDVEYADFGVVVELDGRWHREDAVRRWDDMDRDLRAASEALITLRLGWRHCESDACRTAAYLARALVSRGWAGSPHGCGPSCPLAVASQAAGACEPTA